ncbi:hypothetical protein [Methylorubrum populi]|uniref:hypothetical protein n=1 Tax=Methylorubrum populi TaxID=223967 RepID=UPI000DB7BE14|nr:hypothetical protein [Methylorubrum populi]PZP68373.1 MAG: hypothetical protein DI590_16625 [Methylorubrum populi]
MILPPEYVDFPNGERVEVRQVPLSEIAERLFRQGQREREEEERERLRTEGNRRQRRAAAAKARRRA